MDFDELYAKMGEIMGENDSKTTIINVPKNDFTVIPPCEYNYHDDDHEDLCIFESTLDRLLEPDNQLTEKAQQYRDKLIEGVDRMIDKVNHYRGFY